MAPLTGKTITTLAPGQLVNPPLRLLSTACGYLVQSKSPNDLSEMKCCINCLVTTE